MRIKGTFLSDYVELVNDNPDLDWDSYLTESDWEVVRNTIIPTEWYPVEVMGNIGRGIFDMRSKRNYELVRLHGRARATDAYDDATRKFLEKGDPVASLKAYSMIAGRYIDELKVTVEKSGPTEAYVCFFPVEEAPSWDLFPEIQAGTLEKLVELNGGKDPRAEFITQTREGREACIMHVTWSE